MGFRRDTPGFGCGPGFCHLNLCDLEQVALASVQVNGDNSAYFRVTVGSSEGAVKHPRSARHPGTTKKREQASLSLES